MVSEFHADVDGLTYVWEVKSFFKLTEGKEVFEYKIPSSFLEGYSWGQDHPSTHIHRILNADLQYPIIVWDGFIVDGCHRVCKALSMGLDSVHAIEIVNIPPPDRILEDNPFPPSEKWTFFDVVEIMKSFYSYKDPHERHPIDGI